MYREILCELDEWKTKSNKKHLILIGQKGVGKSYILNYFGTGFFNNTVIFDFKTQDYIRYLFEKDIDASKIETMLSITCGQELVPGETFVVFENIDLLEKYDEIMYFLKENLGEYHMAFTFYYSEELAFNKIGKKKIQDDFYDLSLHSMNFYEFLIACRENKLSNSIKDVDKKSLSEEEIKKIHNLLKVYLLIGGLPNVVQVYVDTKNINEALSEKNRVLFEYKTEMDKIENKTLKNKVISIWESIPKQLLKDNKKFQYRIVKESARAREYEEGLKWLADNKFVNLLYRMNAKKKDEQGKYKFTDKDEKSYEVYFNDIGILSSYLNLEYDDIDIDKLHKLKNGALLLEYVFHELKADKNINNLYYWISESTAKIEFLFGEPGEAIPVCIDIGNNTKAQSLKVYREIYKPQMAIKITKDDFYMKNRIYGVPLYAIWNL